MIEKSVSYMISREDGSRRLVFAVASLPIETLFSIENRDGGAPFVAATDVSFGIFEIDRSGPPRSLEHLVPSMVVESANVVSLDAIKDALGGLGQSDDVKGWRAIGCDGSCYLMVVDRTFQDSDVAAVFKALLDEKVELRRVTGGSYPAMDGEPFGISPVFGESFALEGGAPSFRM